MSAADVAAPAWTDLEGGVRVRRSSAFRMNSVVLDGGDHALIVDPGVLPSELEDLAASVVHVELRAIVLIFTHAHWDHVLGKPWWPEARTVGHDRLAAEMKRDYREIVEKSDALAAEHREVFARRFAPFQPDLEVSGLHFRTLGDWRLVFRDAPGHSDSQLSIHLPERRLLIAADMLSDIEIPFLNRAPAVYRKTLKDLLPLVAGGAIETLVPGHGAIARDRAEVQRRIAADLDYLDRLEREVEALKARGLPKSEALAAVPVWDGIERDPEYPMLEHHRENAGFTWDALPGR